MLGGIADVAGLVIEEEVGLELAQEGALGQAAEEHGFVNGNVPAHQRADGAFVGRGTACGDQGGADAQRCLALLAGLLQLVQGGQEGLEGAGRQRQGDIVDFVRLKGLQAAVLVDALGFIVYYGLTTTHSLIQIQELGLSPQTAFANVCWFQVGMLVGVIVAGMVANRYGVVAALVAPALLMVPALPLFVGAAPGLLTLGAVLGGALGAGYSGVTPVLVTSLFPEHVRARAIGLVYHLGALLAAFVPWGIPELAARTGWKLSSAVELVVGIGLVAMAAAVFGLRRMLAPVAPIAEPIEVIDATTISAHAPVASRPAPSFVPSIDAAPVSAVASSQT